MYQLLTDSCCDLPYQTLHDHQVEFVSMHFTVNGTDYEDDLGEDHYDINAFYEQLKQNVMPTTTQVNVGQFVDFFTPYVKANTPILYVGFSSGLSGTFTWRLKRVPCYWKSIQMRRFTWLIPHGGVLVKDNWYWMPLKTRCWHATDELAHWLTAHRLDYRMWFTVDKLDFLYHGGRVSRTSAALGTMLNIKPVMDVDTAVNYALCARFAPANAR